MDLDRGQPRPQRCASSAALARARACDASLMRLHDALRTGRRSTRMWSGRFSTTACSTIRMLSASARCVKRSALPRDGSGARFGPVCPPAYFRATQAAAQIVHARTSTHMPTHTHATLTSHNDNVSLRPAQVFLTPTHLCIVMEYAAGGELFDRIVRAGRFSEDEARYFFQQLICGVDYCHRSVRGDVQQGARVRRSGCCTQGSGTGRHASPAAPHPAHGLHCAQLRVSTPRRACATVT